MRCGRRWRWPPSSPRCRRPACATTAWRCWRGSTSPRTRRCGTRSLAGSARSPPPRRAPASPVSRPAPAVTDPRERTADGPAEPSPHAVDDDPAGEGGGPPGHLRLPPDDAPGEEPGVGSDAALATSRLHRPPPRPRRPSDRRGASTRGPRLTCPVRWSSVARMSIQHDPPHSPFFEEGPGGAPELVYPPLDPQTLALLPTPL